MFLIGKFLLNSFPDMVLFDSGASQYFGSQSFCRDFNMILGELVVSQTDPFGMMVWLASCHELKECYMSVQLVCSRCVFRMV